MKSFLAAVLAGVVVLCFSSAANATATNEIMSTYGQESLTKSYPRYNQNFRAKRSYRVASHSRHSVGGRPAKWCGWWMRTQMGGGPEYNLARNWAKRGVSAGGPQVGAVVVWPHHVGVITGKASNGQWIVKSGNDSGRVRERARSVSGAIAFRMV